MRCLNIEILHSINTSCIPASFYAAGQVSHQQIPQHGFSSSQIRTAWQTQRHEDLLCSVEDKYAGYVICTTGLQKSEKFMPPCILYLWFISSIKFYKLQFASEIHFYQCSSIRYNCCGNIYRFILTSTLKTDTLFLPKEILY